MSSSSSNIAGDSLRVGNLFDVSGKTALVTGAISGLGRSISEGLIANGATVIVTGRRIDALNELVQELNQRGQGIAIGLELDVSSQDSIRSLPSRLLPHLPQQTLDILVLNAGINIPDPPSYITQPLSELQDALLASSPSAWEDQFRTNTTGNYYITAALLHLLAPSEHHARVILISSIGARHAFPNVSQPGYQTSKAAAEQLTRLLASKLRSTTLRINAIAPGVFDTPMNPASRPGSGSATAAATVPAGRCGGPEDIVGAVIFLASRAGDYVHGQVLDVDGGRRWAN